MSMPDVAANIPRHRVLSRAAAEVVDAASRDEYQGLNFYGSYNKTTDRKLHRWATEVVNTFPGVSVSMVPRRKKRSPPQCPACHEAIGRCPACGAFPPQGSELTGSCWGSINVPRLRDEFRR